MCRHRSVRECTVEAVTPTTDSLANAPDPKPEALWIGLFRDIFESEYHSSTLPHCRMPVLNPPQQPRSRRTLDRIVKASWELLEAEGVDGVTVQAVVKRARSSVGSFYARFGGKDDLLAYLGERAWAEALETWDAAVASRAWSEMSLEEVVRTFLVISSDLGRLPVEHLRALDRASVAGGDAHARFRAHVRAALRTVLQARRGEIEHADADLAIECALGAMEGVVEAAERLRSQEAEEEREAPDRLLREAIGLLGGYLSGVRRDAPGTEAVDFFDVWG